MEPRRLRRDRTRTLLAELPLTDVSEVLLCQFRHHRGQQEYSDEVGDGHKAVEGIGDVPGDLQLHGCAHDDDQREDNLVNLGGLMAQQELPAAGAVQSPGQNRGQGEQRQAHSYNDAGDRAGEHGCEALDGQGRAGIGAELDVVHTHAQQ